MFHVVIRYFIKYAYAYEYETISIARLSTNVRTQKRDQVEICKQRKSSMVANSYLVAET
jgi:hypothetical protein